MTPVTVCFILLIVVNVNANLAILAHQKITGEQLLTCRFVVNETIDERFDRLDSDDNGYFTFNEFLFADQCAVATRQERFERIDTDKSNYIDQREWELHSMVTDMERRKDVLRENRQMFKYFDRNRSNRLEATEVRKYVRFRRCNPTNIAKYFASKGSTGLAFHEFDKFTYVIPNRMFPLGRRNRTMPKVPYYGEENCEKPESHRMQFHRLDSNHDHRMSFVEFLYFERCPIYRHRRKFQHMDRNGDKKVNLAEFRYFYADRDMFWNNVYNMRMNSIVFQYDLNNDMHLDTVELRNYLLNRDIDPKNLDAYLRGRVLSPKEFADWDDGLPNLWFPRLPGTTKKP